MTPVLAFSTSAGGSPVAEYVIASPSGSVAASGSDTTSFSASVWFPGFVSVGGEPTDTTGVFMSVAICAALRATLKILTSSMIPAKYAPQMLSPPIRTGPVEDARTPEIALVPTCAPFTNIRRVVPSKVAARWDHVLTGNCAVPRASSGPLPTVSTSAAGVSVWFAHIE
jgi:hypothetical protein